MERDPTSPVVIATDAHTLSRLLDFKLLSSSDGETVDALLEHLRKVLQYSVRTSHPLFISKLYHGSDPVGQAAELVACVLNTNCHTFEAAPVFTLMECEV